MLALTDGHGQQANDVFVESLKNDKSIQVSVVRYNFLILVYCKKKCKFKPLQSVCFNFQCWKAKIYRLCSRSRVMVYSNFLKLHMNNNLLQQMLKLFTLCIGTCINALL